MPKNLLKKALEHARTTRYSPKQIEFLANLSGIDGPSGSISLSQEQRDLPLNTEEIVLGNINQFYYYFDVVRGLVKSSSSSDKKIAYRNMLGIQRVYPDNQILASRVEEASDYLHKGKK